MSGKLDVSRIQAQPASSKAMPDKQITLTLELPNGKTETMQVNFGLTERGRAGSFRRDLTVDYVKLQLQSKLGLPAQQLELELAGRAMADPMSLSDYPSLLSGGGGAVRVLLLDGAQQDEAADGPRLSHDDAGSKRDAQELEALQDEELA